MDMRERERQREGHRDRSREGGTQRPSLAHFALYCALHYTVHFIMV